jgi:hypothetical protein
MLHLRMMDGWMRHLPTCQLGLFVKWYHRFTGRGMGKNGPKIRFRQDMGRRTVRVEKSRK